MLADAIERIEGGESLSQEEMARAMTRIMSGEVPEQIIVRFLAALHRKGEAVTEVAGAATVLRRQMRCIRTRHAECIDTCGTGGDGSRTFNISTAAAIVTAAAGVPVAKHGNRGITSRSGSADVLRCLGVNVEADVPTVERCLDEIGLCFCFAPLMHQAMRHVSAARRQLAHPTIFNILGPLANPARAPHQLLGVGRAELRPLIAQALQLLGAKRAVVVHGADGLDEVTLDGETLATEVGGELLREHVWTAATFGLRSASRSALLVEGPEQSADLIRRILGGERGPPRDIVVANAAAALWTVGRVPQLAIGAARAGEAIDSGQAANLLGRLVQMSHGR